MAFNPPRNCIQCLSNCIHPLLQVPNWFSIRSFDHIRRISPLPFPCISSIALLVSCVLWVSTNLFRKTCALVRKMSQEREQVLTRTSVFLFHPSNKCPLHIKSLSGVPEEPGVPCPRITGCTLHTARLPESWVGDTSPCCPRAYTRKVGKKPTTYSFNQSSLNSHSWKCQPLKRAANRIVGRTLETERMERDVTAMDIGSGYRDVEALTLNCC